HSPEYGPPRKKLHGGEGRGMLLAFGGLPSDELANVFELGGGTCLRNRPARRQGPSQAASCFPSLLFLHYLPDSQISHPLPHLSLLSGGLLRRILDRQRH